MVILTGAEGLVLNLILNAAIFTVSAWRRFLTVAANIAAFILGTTVFLIGGLNAWIILLAFYIPSTLLTLFAKSKRPNPKPSPPRKINQVAANGGPALIFIVLFAFTYRIEFLIGFAAALSSCSADTWSTELGSFSKTAPISLRNFKPVQAGESGAISGLGTAASFGGALLIALTAGFLLPISVRMIPLILLSGFAGGLIDSLFGAFLQVIYRTEDGVILETRPASPVTFTKVRGIPFINNDAVNFLSSFAAGWIGYALTRLIIG